MVSLSAISAQLLSLTFSPRAIPLSSQHRKQPSGSLFQQLDPTTLATVGFTMSFVQASPLAMLGRKAVQRARDNTQTAEVSLLPFSLLQYL